ncbi:MAG TPA: amidase [Micropepsaceae bacterium]|nr:amidase [Micropepsaceae bacterium]
MTNQNDINRRDALAVAGGAAALMTGAGAMAAGNAKISDIVLMDAHQLSQAIHAKHVSCAEVMSAYLDHIARFNPKVNAIIFMRDRGALMKEAADRDADLSRGGSRGWMHGFPQAIKDLAAAAGIRMTQGSPILKDFVPSTDSIHVERVKRAGAIVIGKTNTPEFGLGSQTYNPVSGTTLNPYDLSKTPGGSSGGACASLALRMLPVADGSDSGGSLRNPAAYCNVFGFRPSFGRVPSDGVDVFSAPFGVSGPLARTVPDLAMLLSTQAGYDPRAPLSNRQDPAVFAGPLNRDLKGVRIAWPGDFNGYLAFEPGILDLCRAALKHFESLGCVVEDARPDYPLEKVWDAWVKLRAAQNSATLKGYYADPAKRKLMKPEVQYEVETGMKLSAFDLVDAAAVRTQWYEAVRRFSERYPFFVLPTAQVFPFDAKVHWPTEINGRKMDTYHRWMEVCSLVSMTGCPSLNVPAGFSAPGLPMGMQIVGRNQDELGCLQMAAAYDQATNLVRQNPPALLGI